jgi:uncharacterized protein (TIGR03086 family)
MDVGECYRRSVAGWLAVAGQGAGDLEAPTPCTDWTVRSLVNHVVGEDRWTKPLVDGRTIAEVGDSLDGDLLGANPVESVHAAADEALTAVAERLPMGGVVHLSYGDEELDEYLRQLTADHLIHAWDLAAATGQDRTLDAEVVTEVAAWYAERESLYRGAGMVAERPASTGDGSPQADLLIAFGRDPDWAR